MAAGRPRKRVAPPVRERGDKHAAQRRYDEKHPRITAHLSREENQRMRWVLQREGQTFTSWTRDRLNEQEVRRNPDSFAAGTVKRTVEEEVAYRAWKRAQVEGDHYYKLAQKVPKRFDDTRKRDLMQLAGDAWDDASFFHGILAQYEEVRLKVKSGAIKPRARTRDREEVDADFKDEDPMELL